MPQNPTPNGLKVALIGDSGVGKSTILSILLGDSFNITYVKTKENVIIDKDVPIGKSQKQRLQIWDTGGDEDIRTYAAYSISNVKAIVIVFDVCDEDSYMHVQNWMKLIKDIIEFPESIVIVIAANKIDKEKKRKVKREQVQQLAHQYNVRYMEVSAKTGKNIHELFQLIAKDLHEKAKQQATYKANTEVDVNQDFEDQEKSFFDKCTIL